MSERPERLLSSKMVTRGVAALAAVAVFLGVASVINPDATVARDEPTPAPAEQEPRAEDATSLGTIESERYTVEMFTVGGERRYTVTDAGGALLLRLGTEDELYALDPEHLDIARMRAQEVGLAPTGDDF